MKINLVFTLAGEYSRFKKSGFIYPKFLLPTFEHLYTIEAIAHRFLTDDLEYNVLYLINKADQKYITKNIIKRLEIFENTEILYIDSTNGQAETAAIAARRVLEAPPPPS